MNVLLIGIALMFPGGKAANQPSGKDNARPAMVKIDGEWTVSYAEVDGKKIEGKDFSKVTIKDNVVTCRHDGKEMSWRLHFGPHHMIRCTQMIDGKVVSEGTKDNATDKGHHTHFGHYIASQEYFCLSMHKGRDHRHFGSTERREGAAQQQPGSADGFGTHGPHGAHFVLILHRTSAAPSR